MKLVFKQEILYLKYAINEHNYKLGQNNETYILLFQKLMISKIGQLIKQDTNYLLLQSMFLLSLIVKITRPDNILKPKSNIKPK